MNYRYGKSILEKLVDIQLSFKYIQDYIANPRSLRRKEPEMPTVYNQCFCCKCEIVSRPIEGHTMFVENIPAFVELKLNPDFPQLVQKSIHMCLSCFRSNTPEEVVSVLS